MRVKKPLILSFVLLALIIIVLYFVLASSTQSTLPGTPKGYSIVIGVATHGNASSERFALDSGVKYFRTDINQSSPQINQIKNESHEYGAQYLGILDYDTMPGGFSNKNQNLSTWNASVYNALANYPEISTWEIWNEPWVSNFQDNLVNGSAYGYYLVIRSAYMIIKAREPNSTIVCFGGAPISNQEVFEWYSQVWSYGTANYCNAISIHAYTSGDTLINQSGTASEWSSGLQMYESLTHKPIWITETGLPSHAYAEPGYYSTATQNSFLEQDIDFFNNFSYVKRVYWYDLWGLSDSPINNDYGLLNISAPYSGIPSPAWYTFLSIYNTSESK